MTKALRIIAAAAMFAFRIPEKLRPCEWLSRHVEIPPITGSLEPGPLDTGRVPPIEGLYDIVHQNKCHFFTLAKSARVGGTLFAICLVLHKIGNNPQAILWVDPSRASARQFFRRELEPFLLACKPVAAQAMLDKEHWTASQVFFKGGSFIRMAGAGSPNEMAGFQAEMVILNEGDKVHHTTSGEAPAHELAIARTKQFRFTRKVIENSTPTDEQSITWRRFLKGSQRHCYLPCPHCTEKARKKKRSQASKSEPAEIPVGWSQKSREDGLAGWFRFTFFSEEVEVPFDENHEPLPDRRTRTEKTGSFKFEHCRIVETRVGADGKDEAVPVGWDLDRVLAETRFRAPCGHEIEQDDLTWMLPRYRWLAHNPAAPRDHESAQWWAAYSPFESWGEISKKFILAGHDPGALHDFYNNDLGRPFRLVPTEVDENDVTKLQNASPAYQRGAIPLRPELLTMTVDVQEQTGDSPFWWTVWAWGIHWDLPGYPTWKALVDYGSAVSWGEIEEIAGLVPIPKRRSEDPEQFHQFKWKDPESGELIPFEIFAGLVDSGDQAQTDANVYDWARNWAHVFSPSKGGGKNQLFHQTVRVSILEKDTPQELKLVWYRSDYFAQRVYRQTIKDRKFLCYLPRNVDAEFVGQVTDERTVWVGGKLVWKAMKKNNHLGDCWKMNEVLAGDIELVFDKLRFERLSAMERDIAETLKNTTKKA